METQSQDDAVNISTEEAPTDAVTDEVKRFEVDQTWQLDAAEELAEEQTRGIGRDVSADVVTWSNRGQWEVVVEGRTELDRRFSSREEAVDQGRALADELGVAHRVEESDATGVITHRRSDADLQQLVAARCRSCTNARGTRARRRLVPITAVPPYPASRSTSRR